MPTINEIIGRNIGQYTKKTNNKTQGFISYSTYQNPTLGTEIKFFIDTELIQDPRKNWDPNYESTKQFNQYGDPMPGLYGNGIIPEPGPVTFYIIEGQSQEMINNIGSYIINNFNSLTRGGKRRRKTNKNKKRRSKKSKRRRIS